jgi:hypothetical protein
LLFLFFILLLVFILINCTVMIGTQAVSKDGVNTVE